MLLLKLQLFFLVSGKLLTMTVNYNGGKVVAVVENVCTQGQFQLLVQNQIAWSQALSV